LTGKYTPAQFVQDVNGTIAPVLKLYPGFKEYLGSVENSTANRANFLTIFDTAENANAYVNIATNYLATGPFNGYQKAIQSLDGTVFTYYTRQHKGNYQNKYIGIRHWTFNDNATATPTEVLTNYRNTVLPQLKATQGFITLVEAVTTTGDLLFIHVATTPDAVTDLATIAIDFLSSAYGDQITRVLLSSGQIGFDERPNAPKETKQTQSAKHYNDDHDDYDYDYDYDNEQPKSSSHHHGKPSNSYNKKSIGKK